MIELDTIPAVVDNVIRLKKDTLGVNLLSELRALLTRENPAYHQMKRMSERNPRYRYIRLPPATMTSVEEDDQTVYIPRGFKNELRILARNHNKRIEFYDETIFFGLDSGMALANHIQLRDYQRKGIGKLILNREGILVAPCGGGKTVAGIAILTILKQPTLVLVHTNDLLVQWRAQLAEKALIPGGVGQWGVGEKQRGQVTVGTIQTLIRTPPKELAAFLNNFGCVILDEAHHCPADTFFSVMNLCSARFRFGLTATPRRKDGLEFLMTDTIGPIVAEITDEELKSEGVSQNCQVRFIATTLFSHYTADQWTHLLGEICQSADRNRLIIDTIVATWNGGHFPLILSERVSHCKMLVEELRKRGMNAHALTGDVPKNVREDIIAKAKQNLIDAIVATKVADEGLDIPSLSCVHLVTPTANEAKTQQRIGRIRRPIEGKTSLVIDYVDPRIPACLRMGKARKLLYRRWGFKLEDGRDL